jgi:hypothetical protein
MLGTEKSWNIMKAIIRIGARIIIEILNRSIINLFDSLFGFLNWPKKKLRIKIFILRDQHGDHVFPGKEMDVSIDYARKVFKKHFNVELMAHHKNVFVEVLQNTSAKALYVRGGLGALSDEFKNAGSFFASNLSGVFFPVTVFVVKNIKGASGCSLGPISDYVTLDTVGAKQTSVLAHELAHACGLWHISERSNLLYPYRDRDDEIRWWQKNIFRSSRHITYW